MSSGEILHRFDDGTPALQRICYGKGAFYLFGFSLGYSLHDLRPEPLCNLLGGILASCQIAPYPYADGKKGIFEKHTQSEYYNITYLFNNSNEPLRVDEHHVVAMGGFLQADGDGWILPAQNMGYLVKKRD